MQYRLLLYIIVGSGCSGCHKENLLHIFFCELRFENLVVGFGEQVGHLHNTVHLWQSPGWKIWGQGLCQVAPPKTGGGGTGGTSRAPLLRRSPENATSNAKTLTCQKRAHLPGGDSLTQIHTNPINVSLVCYHGYHLQALHGRTPLKSIRKASLHPIATLHTQW